MADTTTTALPTDQVVNIPAKQTFLSEIKKLSDTALVDLTGMINDILQKANLNQNGINAYMNKLKIVQAEQDARSKLGAAVSKGLDYISTPLTKEYIDRMKSRSTAIGTGLVVGGIGGFVVGGLLGKSKLWWTIIGGVGAAFLFYHYDKTKNALVNPNVPATTPATPPVTPPTAETVTPTDNTFTVS